MTVQVGWHAHFDSKFNHDVFVTEGSINLGMGHYSIGKNKCWHETQETDGINCPFNVVHLEGIFIFNTILYFVFGAASFLTGLVCKIPGSKLQYHVS